MGYKMAKEKWPKCGSENIDEGSIGGAVFGYKSHKQGLFSESVKDFEAKLCLDCGYVEFYINVDKLKKKLKK
jgi:predicted nucleic-acid-binding Zn-ribbon protein